MEMLIAVMVAQRLHVPHPEMIREGSDLADRLFEAVLDLEAQAIEMNDVASFQRNIGAHQEARASCGMNDGDEAHQPSGRTPDQIADAITQRDIALAVNRTGPLEIAWGPAAGI